jgi:hypothetical protein
MRTRILLEIRAWKLMKSDPFQDPPEKYTISCSKLDALALLFGGAGFVEQ